MLTVCHYADRFAAMVTLRLRLREWREQRGLTQGQLAQQMSLHRSYIAKIEIGDRTPCLTVVWQLAQFFHCPMEALLRSDSTEGREV